MSNNHGGPRPNSGRKPAPVPLKVYSYKASEADHAQMQSNAERAGVSLSEFIRQRCLTNKEARRWNIGTV